MCIAMDSLPTIGSTNTKREAADTKAVDVPLGTGAAEQAKLSIYARRRRLDDAIDAASK